MIDVGKRIIELREAKGYTTNKLANLSGISQSYLRYVELGNKNISVEFLSYICDSLNISLSDFFNDSTYTDEFTKTIFSLNDKQRTALCEFIKSLQ